MYFLLEEDDESRKILVGESETREGLDAVATQLRKDYGEEPGQLFVIDGAMRSTSIVSVLGWDDDKPASKPAPKPRTAPTLITESDKARVLGAVRAKGPIGVNEIAIATVLDGDTVSRILRSLDGVASNGGRGRAAKWSAVAQEKSGASS